jgi:hypothetical protein
MRRGGGRGVGGRYTSVTITCGYAVVDLDVLPTLGTLAPLRPPPSPASTDQASTLQQSGFGESQCLQDILNILLFSQDLCHVRTKLHVCLRWSLLLMPVLRARRREEEEFLCAGMRAKRWGSRQTSASGYGDASSPTDKSGTQGRSTCEPSKPLMFADLVQRSEPH